MLPRMADDNTLGRLHELTARLDALVAENHALGERVVVATERARTWPDVTRATQLLADAQRPTAHHERHLL